MAHAIFLLLLLIVSTPSVATTTVNTTTSAQNFANSTSADLNQAYVACQNYATDPVVLSSQPNVTCLWFAVGDVIKSYQSSTDRVFMITVSAGQEGWYRVNRFTVQPNATPEPLPASDIYLGEFFDLSFAIYAYRATSIAPADGAEDYRATYQGFRSASACQKTNNFTLHPTYDPIDQHEHDRTALINNLPSVHGGIEYTDLYPSVTNCSTPNAMGLSCQFTNTVQMHPDQVSYQGSLLSQGSQTLTRCDDLEDWGFPARLFLTGQDKPTLTHPEFTTFTEQQNYNGTVNVYETDLIAQSQIVTVHAALYLYNFDGVIGGTPDPEIDSDGDGTPDSQDAFPFDPTETTDTDGDGVGDNSDSDPNNPNIGSSGGGTGTTTTTTTDNGDGTTTEDGVFELPDWNPTGVESTYTDRSPQLIEAETALDTAINDGVSAIESLFTPTFPSAGTLTCDAGVNSSQGINVSICWTDYITYIASVGVVILLMASFQSIRILLMG